MATLTTVNFNVGVLGHIDSGKTSLAKALSTIASTACFDKNPQSRERGITLDLGFSSFTVDIPEHMANSKYDKMQVTLVDCPGHASLIKTIIGGAQIIDLMMLVVDIVKGVQTQTAECLVLGEITCSKLMVVLNKTDLLPEDSREGTISKMTKKLRKTLEKTKFKDAPIIPVAAKPGGPDAPETESIGVKELVAELRRAAYLPERSADGPFIFAADHCFSIRGQGTVMTGTIISGKVATNDVVEIPSMKMTRKVKSMQMFRVPVDIAKQGDRVGICVTQFDPKLLERGLVCAPNILPTIYAAIIHVARIPYHKGTLATKAKFHISLGHETVMAKVHFFGLSGGNNDQNDENFEFSHEYMYLEGLTQNGGKDENSDSSIKCQKYFALLEFEKPVTAPRSCLVIGSRLDTDIHLNTCRLAFQGKMVHTLEEKNYAETILPNLKVFKNKIKEGSVERMVNEYEVIGRGLFKKETNIQYFSNLKVVLSTGENGTIEGGFGQSGKVKIRVPDGLKDTTLALLDGCKKKGKGKPAPEAPPPPQQEVVKIYLHFKRYVYDAQKKMIQTR